MLQERQHTPHIPPPQKKYQCTQLWSDQAIDLHRFSDCSENWKHEISCSWKTKKKKVWSWDLVWPMFAPSSWYCHFAKCMDWREMLYRVCVFVWMLWVKRHCNEIMFRDYWFGGFLKNQRVDRHEWGRGAKRRCKRTGWTFCIWNQ